MNTASSPSPRPNRLHRRYLAVLPRIVRHAQCYFRWIKCYHTKQDKVQEAQALCWKWIKKLQKRGRAWWQYVSRLADYACRQVRSGRKIAGSTRINDIMNEINQIRRGYYVGKLPDFSTETTNPLVEALTDNTVSPVPDQVAFRLDYPVWRGSYDDRRQRIIDALAVGHRTTDVARRFQVSEGRISQMRREFLRDWERRGSPDES